MLPINLNEQNYAEINNEIFKLTFVVFFFLIRKGISPT